ncbi:MAG: diguanylate cyclase [Deltaproteobacteria bacterium]|nr:diguanylate cyclase [Deltaproteobacteria bacterium]
MKTGGTADRHTVVAIDDEEGDLAVIDALLSDDYEVICTSSGEEAIRILEACPTAIVLCDQRMPGLTGDEVVSRLRVLYPDSVRVLVTGWAELDAIVRALNEGQIFAYLRKPFDAAALRATVARAVQHQQVRLENRALLEEVRRMRSLMDQVVRERTALLEEENRALKDLSLVDELTRLNNVRALRTGMKDDYERCVRLGRPVSLLMADVDHFKRVNDEHGHAAGDAVLKRVADVLRTTIRGADVVARYGGEEFVVLAPGSAEAGATVLAERLRGAVEAASAPNPGPAGGTLAVTISIGVAGAAPDEAPPLDEVLRRADEAMYQAKKAGRNRVVTWSDVKRVLATKPQSTFIARSPAE